MEDHQKKKNAETQLTQLYNHQQYQSCRYFTLHFPFFNKGNKISL